MRKIRVANVIVVSLFVLFIVLGINFFITYKFNSKVFEVLEASIQNNNDIISQITVDKKKRVVITPALVQQIKNFQSVKNDDFMRSYYETQSNWLNMWLTILTIVLGILAVVLPVCFMKFYEDKKKDIEKRNDCPKNSKKAPIVHSRKTEKDC